jgi:hypothetical protein
MLTDQELQRLRNQANECEQAADEIVELRAERDALLLDRQQRAAPSAEPVRINYAVLYDFAAEQNIDYNALGTAVRAALGVER